MRAALFSGGKDSTLAIHKVHAENPVELLITMVSDNDFSYMFHKPNIDYSKMQADALGIRQVIYKTKGEKEKELKDIEDSLVENRVTELVTGAVASTYQKERIEKICERLSIKPISPIWHIDPIVELSELAKDYEVIVTQVAAEGFDRSFLGARIDNTMIEKLKKINEKYRINMLFEGGEAESFVLDAPLFKKRIIVTKSHVTWSGSVGRFIIDEADSEWK
ncbi:MAG: diphthine--ammonia ligase [Candidatus Micrarchaeaceae archaeon]|jgi:ABC transporter with metal-binding/Fe-S-binding domain ATP-binding protein|nr:diphthine--ammonia ligase [Candidatus Micrarchaeota archaeon]